MKKFVLCVSIIFGFVSLAWADPTMEQVNVLPQNYEDFTVVFYNVEFKPDPTRKDFEAYFDGYTGVVYCLGSVRSEGGTFFTFPNPFDFDMNLYMSQSLAAKIIGDYTDIDNYHNANFTCIVEIATGKDTLERDESYCLPKIIKIEMLDSDGNVEATYTDDGTLPTNPWDVDLNGKIGLEEAIYILQLVSGTR